MNEKGEPEDSSTQNLLGAVSDDDEVDYSTQPEFYDQELDDKDELWVQKQRGGRASDAVLCCPACFTTLCLDCQRYARFVAYFLTCVYMCVFMLFLSLCMPFDIGKV
ncbi:UNVERIFIED_CONTAM: E2F-associated phosphoprotein [Sesamum latifolium]|uniref:E2F-associated phosphoprotein n=1 Tax=Sesamum latifolium TaxID=2727402 RepID=A0AAW2UTW7_9LAMI